MAQNQIDILRRALEREKKARYQAEKILEHKSLELHQANLKLRESKTKVENLLKEKTSELKGVFENLVDAYVVIDLKGNVLKMNNAAVKLLGYNSTDEDVNLMNLAHPEETEKVISSFGELLVKGSLTDFEVRIITKDQSQKLVHVNCSLIYDNNQPIAAQGIARDITKERASENKIIESQERLAALILNLDSGILLEDQNQKIVLVNNKFCDFFQIPVAPEILIGTDCSEAAEQSKCLFLDPDKFVESIDKLLHDKKTVLGQELYMKDGRILERDFITIVSNNNYHGHLWSYRDITLKKRYEQSIKEQKEKYSRIIANMNLGIIEVDNNDTILMVNRSFCEMSGYSAKELVGRKGADIFLTTQEKKHFHKENLKRKEGHSSSYELEIKNKNGDTRYWLVSGAPNKNINGEIIGSIGIHLDITELKSLEIQKEKLLKKLEKSNDELHEYAHIVSHDLKSPLRSIDALVTWIAEDNHDKLDELSKKNIDLVKSTLEKMENLISEILEYSSISSHDFNFVPVDTHELVIDLIKMLQLPHHINFKILNQLPVVRADKVKLQQLFQNLITNAVKYNDKKNGIIVLDCVEQAGYYKFCIEDNGIGIEPKHQKDIFKIFHAVNKSKDSTGIGLSIVKKIVELHEGEIYLESEPGKGTKFYFTIKK
jgi:PAS domain S-box-containing protein